MEWEDPAIVLEVAPHGEGDALATVLTARGLWRGLAKGGASRRHNGLWQPGNIIAAHWLARLESQLGAFTAELVRPVAALVMHDAEALAILNAACALAAGALPEREAAPACFAGLLRLMAGLDIPGFGLTALCHWEILLLRELGFGLDFSAPAGDNDQLAYVSPRTGRAVTLAQAGDWRARLLPLPAFLLEVSAPDASSCAKTSEAADIVAALRLSGHFLARDVFGSRHRPLPPARARLYESLCDKLPEDKHAD